MSEKEIMEQFEYMLALIEKNKVDKERYSAGIRYAMGWFDSVLKRKTDENKSEERK